MRRSLPAPKLLVVVPPGALFDRPCEALGDIGPEVSISMVVAGSAVLPCLLDDESVMGM